MTLPFWLFGAFFGAFVYVAMNYRVTEGMTAAAAVGKSLQTGFASARQFLQLVAVSVTWAGFALITWLIYNLLSMAVVAGTATTAFSNAWQGTSNSFTDAEQDLSLIFGMGVLVLVLTVVHLVVMNAAGLWIVGYTRQIARRPLGAHARYADSVL